MDMGSVQPRNSQYFSQLVGNIDGEKLAVDYILRHLVSSFPNIERSDNHQYEKLHAV